MNIHQEPVSSDQQRCAMLNTVPENQNKTLPSDLYAQGEVEEIEWLAKARQEGRCSLCGHLKTYHIQQEYNYCLVGKADGTGCGCEGEPLNYDAYPDGLVGDYDFQTA